MIRPFSELDLRALKTMTSELVSACGGTRAASLVLPTAAGGQVAEAHISSWATQTDMSRFMPAHHLVRLEIAAEQPIVSNWMMGRLSRDGSAPAAELGICDALRLMQRTATLNGAVSEAFQDRHVSSAERADIREEIQNMRRLLDDLERKVEQP